MAVPLFALGEASACGIVPALVQRDKRGITLSSRSLAARRKRFNSNCLRALQNCPWANVVSEHNNPHRHSKNKDEEHKMLRVNFRLRRVRIASITTL